MLALFVLPVAVHGFWHWSPRIATDPNALSPRLVSSLRTKVPKGAVVLAPLRDELSRGRRDAPVYVVAAAGRRTSRTRGQTTRTAAPAP